MNDAMWVAIFALGNTLLIGGVQLWIAFKIKHNGRQVVDLHTSVNSKMDKLLKTTRDLARLEGRDEERARVSKNKRSKS